MKLAAPVMDGAAVSLRSTRPAMCNS